MRGGGAVGGGGPGGVSCVRLHAPGLRFVEVQNKSSTSLNSGFRVFFFTVVLYFDFFPMSGCSMLRKRRRERRMKRR